VGDKDGVLTIVNARMIVHYSADAHGLLGVAAHGPGAKARVSPRVDEWRGRAIEQWMTCSDAARAAIEAEPWT